MMAIELLFVLPILLALILASIEFSMLLSARQQITSATREAARVAALGGGEKDVQRILDRFLGPNDVTFRMTTARANGDPLEPGDPVEVKVTAPTTRFVPELMCFVGFSLKGTHLVSTAVMLRE